MTIHPGAYLVLMTCRSCGHIGQRWLDEFPPGTLCVSDAPPAILRRMRCTRCGAREPRIYVRWEPKAEKYRTAR